MGFSTCAWRWFSFLLSDWNVFFYFSCLTALAQAPWALLREDALVALLTLEGKLPASLPEAAWLRVFTDTLCHVVKSSVKAVGLHQMPFLFWSKWS